MDTIPPGIFIVAIAVLSALAGGGLVWLLFYLTGGGSPPSPSAPREGEEGRQGHQLLSVVERRGNLTVLVQGRRFRHLRKIPDAEMGLKTVEAIKAVLSFAEGWLPAQRAAERERLATAPEGGSPTTFEPPAFEPEEINPPSIFEGSLPESDGMLPELNLIDQVDDLIQERLRTHETLAGRVIRLTSGPRGLRIYVDRQVFEGVGDITDTEVRTLIQDAIAEWEKRNRS